MNTRKHLPLMISALAFAVCACDNEGIVSDCITGSQKLTITASSAEGDAGRESKTVLQENGSVWWNPGDALSLFYGSGSNGGSRL